MSDELKYLVTLFLFQIQQYCFFASCFRECYPHYQLLMTVYVVGAYECVSKPSCYIMALFAMSEDAICLLFVVLQLYKQTVHGMLTELIPLTMTTLVLQPSPVAR